MFKKLRWKIVRVSALVLFLVICSVAGVTYWITSQTVMSQTRVLMEMILDHDGELPVRGEFNPQQETFLALSPESINEIRYYTALINEDITRITDSHIAIKEEEAIAIAKYIYRRKDKYGSISIAGNHRMNYAKQINEDGSILIAVLDSTSRYGLIRVAMMDMSALWFLVLILYIIIMSRYSEKLLQPFAENDEKQKRFITNASHELKTPLAVISANMEMEEATGGRSKWTESTRRQVSKLQALIENLVVLSRLGEVREVDMTDINLSAATAETVEAFRSVIESSGKRCTIDIALNVHGKTEKRSFQQLVSILMDNAAKYCDESGEVHVTLSGRGRGKGARLAVSNTYAQGRNVDYSRFFERFYREDSSHNSAKAGFGIGLSIGKEIVERFGGKLQASYAGDTITFAVEL